MTQETQQTAVETIYRNLVNKIVLQDLSKEIICINITHDEFLKLFQQAKEMEKEQTLKFGIQCQLDFIKSDGIRTVDDIYEKFYGGNK